MAEAAVAAPAASSLVPRLHVVEDVRPAAAGTVTMRLAPMEPSGPVSRPGQFNMLMALGVGEVPISMGGLDEDGLLVHTVREAGAITARLCALEPGDVVGVRGPYGTAWPLGSATPSRASQLLVVAGGIGLAPLRSVIQTALTPGSDLAPLAVALGARTPADLLHRAEYGDWRDAGATVAVTVDAAPAPWFEEVGVVTKALHRLVEGPGTVAFVCGPEVMMRVTARELVGLGVDPARVFVSVERNMECGVGHCGHCQLGPLLLCRDGPIVSWERAAPLLGVPRW